MKNTNKPTLYNIKPTTNKILVKQLVSSTSNDDTIINGILIPQTSNILNSYETLAEIIAISDDIIRNDYTYYDVDFDRRKKFVCSVGDIIKINFNSIDYIDIEDEKDKTIKHRIFNISPTRISVLIDN